ncbi:uncharacterized protein DS421_11g326010 [Arachis hypogaea]|nr:uncharacterized protein DS421_11g326010 [Arachis hypogaea]
MIPFKGMELEGVKKNMELRLVSRHKRSKSFPDKKKFEEDNTDTEATDRIKLDTGYLTECCNSRTKQTATNDAEFTLKQEILQLERRLQYQFEVRSTLEKALGYRPSSSLASSNDTIVPRLGLLLLAQQPTTELIKEIAVLELEVVYLEQHLLSLYRKAFDPQLPSVSPPTKEERVESPLITTPRARYTEVSRPHEVLTERECSAVQSNSHMLDTIRKEHTNGYKVETPEKEHSVSQPEEQHLDSGVYRCHSSLSHCPAFATAQSPTASLRACHSQPLSMMEDMVKCIAAIYCKLADPPTTNPGLSSPSSSLSSVSAFSVGDHGDMWSPGFRNNSSFDVRLDNPFHVEGLKEFSGPYSTMVEVSWIYRDNTKLGDTEQLLQNFRSIISRLEDIDPGKLKHEEKLAFWINIHNALVMHAFLAYGIPQNNVKRVFLLLKAAYNVGGHTVSADTIQSAILGCRMSRPGQWLRMFFSSRTKFKAGNGQQAYAIEHPEPLLHFALCSGNHSDPAVRVYTPKRVLQELEVAKEEYVRATFGVRRTTKYFYRSSLSRSSRTPACVLPVQLT